jgi:cysteine desulfurase
VGLSNVNGEILTISLDLEGLAVSGGSACQSGATGGSHVIRAMYGDDGWVPLRFSFGHATTEQEIDRAVTTTVRIVERLRSDAPTGSPA